MRSGQALQDWVDYQVASWMDHKVALKVAVFRLSENREQIRRDVEWARKKGLVLPGQMFPNSFS